MKKRIIKSSEIDGYISAQLKSKNSITFCGNLPENVKAENILILGKCEINGVVYENTYVENIEGAVVQHHKNDQEIATVYFLDGIPEKFLADVQNYVIDAFLIDCIEVCPCCGG